MAQVKSGLQLIVRKDLAEASLWRQYLNQPDANVRRQIFEFHVDFAKRIARNKFGQRPPGNFELADVEQLAFEGLLQSIERYDPLRGNSFQSYARPRITGNIATGLGKTSEVNAYFTYRYRVERDRLESVKSDAAKEKSAIATLSKIAATLAIGIMMEDTVDPEQIASPTPSAYDTLVWTELQGALHEKVDNLPEKEAFLIRQHYHNGISFQQIALLLGLSKGRVSQLHAAALTRLRAQISKVR